MTELVSATTLIKDALGTSRGLVVHGKKTIAGIAYDKGKLLEAYREEDDREGAIKWLLDQEWAGLAGAQARGTVIHKIAEAFHLGVAPPEYEAFLDPFVKQYIRFLDDFKPEFLMAEAPVYNRRYAYAGTLDGIAVIEGQKVVVDIKTTAHGPNATDDRGNPKARPPFPEVALQLCLYRRAESVGLLAERKEVHYRRYYVIDELAHLEPMPETDGGVCVVVSPEDYLVVPVDTGEKVWRYCRAVIQTAKFQTEYAKTVFGPTLQPKVAA